MNKPKNKSAVALGRLGGLVKSERKTKAVTLNGLKGVEARKLKLLPKGKGGNTSCGESTLGSDHAQEQSQSTNIT